MINRWVPIAIAVLFGFVLGKPTYDVLWKLLCWFCSMACIGYIVYHTYIEFLKQQDQRHFIDGPKFEKDQLVYFLTDDGVKNAIVIQVGIYDLDDVDIGYEYVLSNGQIKREHVLFESFWKAKNYLITQTN